MRANDLGPSENQARFSTFLFLLQNNVLNLNIMSPKFAAVDPKNTKT